jgi:hypothetical protein
VYRSQCIALRGAKGSGSEISKFLIEALRFVALFELVKATFCRRLLLVTLGSNRGRIMNLCLQKQVNIVCFIKVWLKNNLLTEPIKIFEVLHLMQQDEFPNTEKVLFFGLCESTYFSCVIICFKFLIRVRSFFLICARKSHSFLFQNVVLI